ncbi:predicted protein [Naegleria gruberi]|uniref:Predicted protein n=1 Tax=Naegleria gruberi TaxID=5762 RepID=D2VQQ0_NAEGR|nr:uncharacterized protein NAEGRDRAFT_71305 [Naegleria gruberi]EFC40911.1 predicted protein [Naegleria gruberi]|eukprot:XP_002673655.1 predicted protein [Naegleria gruberi strain NEG-M]
MWNILCIAILVVLCSAGYFYFNMNNTQQYNDLDIYVPIEYILFCISEQYQIANTSLLEPLIRKNFNKDNIKTLLNMLTKHNKIDVVNNLVNTFRIRADIAENIVDFIGHQAKQAFPFSKERMDEFLWRKAKIRDALSSIEDITTDHEHVNNSDTFIYKVNDGNWYIFNNLSKFKKAIHHIPLVLGSAQRCRMSFEVKGQPRTGKTLCSKYVLPYFCATSINRKREQEGLTKLSRAPVFYLMMVKNGNPIRDLYHELKKHLSEIINYHPEHEFKENGELILEVRTYIHRFFDVYSDSHMFIVLDEIQLIDSKYLDSLRTIIKSRDFLKCTFILTGSTQSMFNLTMEKTCRNGLSFFDNTIVYDIPFSNSPKRVEESLKTLFHKGALNRSSITAEETLMIQSHCTDLNVAYVSQILKYEHDLKLSFTKSLNKLVEEILKIYDRDVVIDSATVLAILNGDLESLEDTCFVTKVKGQLLLTDKLFTIFLNNNFMVENQGKAVIKKCF